MFRHHRGYYLCGDWIRYRAMDSEMLAKTKRLNTLLLDSAADTIPATRTCSHTLAA